MSHKNIWLFFKTMENHEIFFKNLLQNSPQIKSNSDRLTTTTITSRYSLIFFIHQNRISLSFSNKGYYITQQT